MYEILTKGGPGTGPLAPQYPPRSIAKLAAVLLGRSALFSFSNLFF